MQNKAAKLILDKVKHSSATEAINELYWLVLFSFEMYVAREQLSTDKTRINFLEPLGGLWAGGIEEKVLCY